MLVQRLAGLFFCLLFTAYGLLSETIQLDFWAEEELFNARTFPQMIAIGGAVVSLLYALFPSSLITGTESAPATPHQRFNWIPVLALVALMLALSFSLETLGFVIAMSLFLSAGFWILGERRPLFLLLPGPLVVVFLATLLNLLEIHLEPGLLRVFDD